MGAGQLEDAYAFQDPWQARIHLWSELQAVAGLNLASVNSSVTSS